MVSIINCAMTQFADERKLVCDQQHGFVRGRSCLTNLLESWTEALDESYELDIIYVNYLKAFDTIPHQKLLLKLRSIGMPYDIVNWIAAFLLERKMRVGVNGAFSSWTDISRGVPERSVLGPLLLILFVNDLPDWLTKCMRMFAEDTKVWCAVRDLLDSQVL